MAKRTPKNLKPGEVAHLDRGALRSEEQDRYPDLRDFLRLQRDVNS